MVGVGASGVRPAVSRHIGIPHWRWCECRIGPEIGFDIFHGLNDMASITAGALVGDQLAVQVLAPVVVLLYPEK